MRLPWGLNRLEIPELWSAGFKGQGMRIGLLDTGVDDALPALAGRVSSYHELDQAGWPVPSPRPADPEGHGTHLAGILCGGGAGGFSTLGVAPEARLCCARATDGGHVIARILSGLDWLLDQGVRVACLPLGVDEATPVFDTMLEAMRRHEILPVVSIGNRGAGHAVSPAHSELALTVGAIDRRGRVSRFSGSLNVRHSTICLKPEVLAPGQGIYSASTSGGLVRRSGTSMACGFAAGVATLLFQARPQSTAEEVKRAMVETARPQSADESHRAVVGTLDPPAALQRVLRRPGRAGRRRNGA